jgi:hypothetical protein
MWLSPVAESCNYGKFEVLIIRRKIKIINYAQTGVDMVTHTSLYCPPVFFPLRGKPRCRTFFLYLMVNLFVAVSESVSRMILDHPPSCGLAVSCRPGHLDLQFTRTCTGFYYKNEPFSPQEPYFNIDNNL